MLLVSDHLLRAARRRLISIVAAAAVIATACGGGGGSSDGGGGDQSDVILGVIDIEDPPGLTPRSGGTVRFGLNSEVDGLNPTTSALAPSGIVMASAVFDSLTAYAADGTAVPYLAESVETTDDGHTWEVTVRDGITFHDGTPLDADAVIANNEAQRSAALVGLALRPYFADPAAEKVDERTVRFHLLDADMAFPTTLTTQLGLVASPTWLAAAKDDATLNQKPVGTGPFKFDRRTQDSETRFVRNEDWWNGEVYLDALEFVIVTDGDVRANLLTEGELDGMHVNDAIVISDLREDDSIQLGVESEGEEQLDLINTSKPPFDDIRARMALIHATPQERYVSLLGVGVAPRANQMFSPTSPYHNPDVVQETDQPDKAVDLVAEYCADEPSRCTNGKIDFVRQTTGPSVNQTREADLLIEGWSVAFNVTSKEVAEDAHIQSVAFGQYQVADWRQFGGVDPRNDYPFMQCRTISAISLNWPRYCDEERDRLLNEAIATDDPAERAALYQQVVAQIDQAHSYIFHIHAVWGQAFRNDVHGMCNRLSPEGVPLRCHFLGRTYFPTVWKEA